MANYEYIISSLPALSPDWKFGEGSSFGTVISWIKTQLGASEARTLDTLLNGFEEVNLSREFYESALADPNRFIREYFSFDLGLRNAKASFVNRSLGLAEGKDTIDLEAGESVQAEKVEAALEVKDLLEREHALDAIVWNRIGEISLFNYFDLDAVLAYVAKLHIIDRWASLDEETGREMFHRLIDEVRGSFKGVNDNIEYED